MYLEDLGNLIKETIDPYFGFSRYAESLGRSANSFDELYAALNAPVTFLDIILLDILEKHIQNIQPKLVCLSVPFPGNLYSAFRCAQWVKENHPEIKISMGGGFPNTELRSLSDKRVFEFFDFITLDDGELPVELLCNAILKGGEFNLYKRTFLLENDEVVYRNDTLRSDYKQADVGTPDYSDLQLDNVSNQIQWPQ